MLSSPKIIKAQNSLTQGSATPIHTELIRESMPEPEYLTDPEQQKLLWEKKRLEQWTAAAHAEKEQILLKAHQEAETLILEAQKAGYAAGEKQGRQKGYTVGYEEGHAKARQEAEIMKNQAVEQLKEAAQYTKTYFADKKNEVIELAAQMAEKIIHEKLDTSAEKIMVLIEPVLRRLQQENQFITLWVTSEHVELVKERLQAIEAEHRRFRFAVLIDDSLEKNGCIIETNHALIDQQIGKRLAAMVTDLQLLEEPAHV